jgi:hypothetical protein
MSRASYDALTQPCAPGAVCNRVNRAARDVVGGHAVGRLLHDVLSLDIARGGRAGGAQPCRPRGTARCNLDAAIVSCWPCSGASAARRSVPRRREGNKQRAVLESEGVLQAARNHADRAAPRAAKSSSSRSNLHAAIVSCGERSHATGASEKKETHRSRRRRKKTQAQCRRPIPTETCHRQISSSYHQR